MKFDLISIIFILIILISVIIGIKKGLFKMLVKIIKGVFSWLIAIFLAKPLGGLLANSSLGTLLSSKLHDSFVSKGGIYTLLIDETNKTSVVEVALNDLNLPDFIDNFLVKFISKNITITQQSEVADVLAKAITYYSLVLISCLLIFIVVRLIVCLLSKLFKSIIQIPVLSFINKILGGLFSGVIGLFIVCGITYVITLIMPFNEGFQTFITNTLMLDDPNAMSFSKFIYQNNLLLLLITFIQNLFV